MPDQLHVTGSPVRGGPPGPVREYALHGNRVQDVPGPRAAPPPRPPVASRLPVPGSEGPPPCPWIVVTTTVLWFLVVVAGLVGLVVAAVDLEALRLGLLAEAHADDRDATEQQLVNGVVLTLATVALLCDLALLLAIWGLRLIDRRRRGAVGMLVTTAVLTLLVVAVAQGMVAGGATDLDRQAFLVQAALVLPATLALLTPRSRAWLHGDD